MKILRLLAAALTLTAACSSPYLPLAPKASTGGGSSGGGGGGSSAPVDPAFTFAVTSNGMAAAHVIGQSTMTGSGRNTTQTGLRYPEGLTVTKSGILIIGDAGNTRMMIYNSIPTADGAAADLQWGETSWTSRSTILTSNSSTIPLTGWVSYNAYGGRTVAHNGDVLLAVDQHRVAIFDAVPTVTGSAMSRYLGGGFYPGNITGAPGPSAPIKAAVSASIFSDQAFCIAAGGNRIALIDRQRILLWDSMPTANSAAASHVLGATAPGGPADKFTWSAIPEMHNMGSVLDMSGTVGSDISATTFGLPLGIWTNGTKLAVTDQNAHRVLLWDSWPTSNNQPADHVLGQTTMSGCTSGAVSASTLNAPFGVWSNGTKLFVCDANNNRVLVWDTWPTANGQAADHVIGQPDFTSTTSGATATTLNWPDGVTGFMDKLLVSDNSNSRVLIYQ